MTETPPMLAGIRVVELATYIAGPGACALLADWGAEVVKVEPPTGDPHRQYFGFTGDDMAENRVFDLDNRGKRSIALDLTDDADRAVLHDLIATADVFVTNTRPASLARIGLDWGDLKARHPRLIFVQFTGYGSDGPDAGQAGFDVTAFWARSGLCSLATVKGGEPPMLRTGIGDHSSALALTAGIMTALFHRERTGMGQKIEGSLLRTGVYVGGSEHAIQLQLGRLASPRPRREAVNPIGNFFQSVEGRWFILVPRSGGDGNWPAIARAAGRPELIDDPRFASVKARRANTAALVDLLDAAFGAMSWEAVQAALRAEDLVFAPVQSIAEVTQDTQAHAAGCYVRLDGEDAILPAGPLAFETPTAPPRRAPALDADGAAIRAALAKRAGAG